MALGMSTTLANACLANEVSTYDNIKLHVTGEPGAAGTSNPATETDRQAVIWGSASGGTFSNTNDLEWTSVAGTEDYLYFTAWTDLTAGTFGFSGSITANPVTAGDTFTIQAGDLDVTYNQLAS